jgi:hypothetical protein
LAENDEHERQFNSPADLDLFARKVLKHWEEFRPKMCRKLKEKGQLYLAAQAAAERTSELLMDLWHGKAKLPYDQAREIAYREWYLLPDEKEHPNLTFDPAQLERPETFD